MSTLLPLQPRLRSGCGLAMRRPLHLPSRPQRMPAREHRSGQRRRSHCRPRLVAAVVWQYLALPSEARRRRQAMASLSQAWFGGGSCHLLPQAAS